MKESLRNIRQIICRSTWLRSILVVLGVMISVSGWGQEFTTTLLPNEANIEQTTATWQKDNVIFTLSGGGVSLRFDNDIQKQYLLLSPNTTYKLEWSTNNANVFNVVSAAQAETRTIRSANRKDGPITYSTSENWSNVFKNYSSSNVNSFVIGEEGLAANGYLQFTTGKSSDSDWIGTTNFTYCLYNVTLTYSLFRKFHYQAVAFCVQEDGSGVSADYGETRVSFTSDFSQNNYSSSLSTDFPGASESGTITAESSTQESASVQAYFKAIPNTSNGKVFVGWKQNPSDESYLSTSAEYSSSINVTSSHLTQLILYAVFGDKYERVIKYQNSDATSATILVDEVVANAFNFSECGTDNNLSNNSEDNFYYTIETLSISSERAGCASGHDQDVITYDPNTKKLTAWNAGTAKITFYQKETSEILSNGEEGASFTITVSKLTAPTLSCQDLDLNWSSTYDNPFSSTNKDYEHAPLVVTSLTPDLATWNDENKQIETYAGDEETVSFKVQQLENYKYQPSEESIFLFNFAPALDETCYVIDVSTEYDITNPDFKSSCTWTETEDVADKLIFNAKSDNGWNHGINIYQTIDVYDYLVDYINSSVSTNWRDPLFEKSLDPAAKKVWFKANNTNGNRYIKNLKVTRRTFIVSSEENVEFPTILPNTSYPKTVIIHWSCCNGGDIHIRSNSDKFSISPETITTGTCYSGNSEITIFYNPTEIHEQDEAVITLFNSTNKATILCTGNTAQRIGEGAVTQENEPEGTFIWVPRASPYNWSDPSNWKVYSDGKYYETNSAPLSNSTVKIPSSASIYPTIHDGDLCRQIYFEAGGRVENQHLLKYEEAFVDVEVNNNRYVRITPPLQNTYSGDFFTQWQGGVWNNGFSPASYNGEEGKSGPNRVYNSQGYGQTYISLFATPSEMIDTYGNTSFQVKLLDSQEGWTAPANGLGQRFGVSEAFDIWMDNDNEPTSTFHFPSNDKSYFYFIRQTGKHGDIEIINRDKKLGQGRFAYDMTNTTTGGLMEQVFKHSDLISDAYPMFAIGNPSLAFMDVKEFMRQNVVQGYITPYFYKNSECNNGRGVETIYYYHNPTSSLFRVTSFDSDDNPVPSTDESDRVTDLYVNPNEGFRVMAGETEVYSAAYELVGCYSSENCYYRYHGVHVIKTDITDRDYVQAGGNDSERIRNISFAISADSDDPFKVWISNFVGRGYVEGTINPVDHTIRIKNGTPVYQVSTDNEWSDTRILRVYGATSHRLKFGERFYYHGNKGETYKVENISPLSEDGIGDVIIDYDINQSTHKVTLTLRDPFALYSESFAKGIAGVMEVSGQYTNTHTPMVGSQIKEECEAFFVYDAFHAQRTYGDPSDDFILHEALGEYKTPIESKYGNIDIEETLIPAKNNGDDSNYETTQPSAYFDNIKMRRMTGSHDLVLIKGIYPGDTQCSIIGQIIQENDKYKLLIPGGQKVHDDGTDDKYNDYYLYICHEGDMGYMAKTIELEWNGYDEWQQTLQDNRSISAWTIPNLFGDDWQIGRYYYSSQISHLSDIVGHDGVRLAYHEKYNASDVFSGKFHIYDRFTLTRISDDQGIEEANSSSDPSKENKLEVRYTKDMFKANKPNNNAYAPQRIVSEQNSLENDLIFISATTQNGFHANTLLVVEEKAQKGFNAKEDAPLFDVTNARFSFATLAGSQLVGVNVFNDWDSIPLFLSESATLRFRNIQRLGADVVLYDAINNIYTPLHNNQEVEVSIEIGEEAGRYFICHAPLSPNSATSLPMVDYEGQWNPIAYSPAKGKVVINTCTDFISSVHLYTISGLLVDNIDVMKQATFNNLASGIYIVQIEANQQVRQIKVRVY